MTTIMEIVGAIRFASQGTDAWDAGFVATVEPVVHRATRDARAESGDEWGDELSGLGRRTNLTGRQVVMVLDQLGCIADERTRAGLPTADHRRLDLHRIDQRALRQAERRLSGGAGWE